MCGLFLSYKPLDDNQMEKAFKAIHHRGFIETRMMHADFSAGHTRLPIINLEQGDQPAFQDDGSWTYLVGEILNYKQFRPEATTDTEVIGELLGKSYFGSSLHDLHFLDGFWAVVHYNPRIGEVIALNDFLSIKPLYYSRELKLIASEPSVFQALYSDTLTPDSVFFSNVLKWGYDPTGRTPWNEVKQLPPGHYIGVDMNPIPYWDWQLVPTTFDLRKELIRAVKNRLISDVPVSLLLSGGLDSTIVFRILTHILEQTDLIVFHVENQEQDALRDALEGFPSQPLPVTLPTEEEAVRAFQAPVDVGSLLPQLGLAKAVAEQGFHVTLSGDGADELFGGYTRSKEYDSQASDTFIELPYWHLPRLDRMMMAYTIELRSPYLAPSVIKAAMSIPWEQRRGEKQTLKQSFKDILPPSLMTRQKRALKSQQVREEGLIYRKRLISIWEQQR